MFDIKRELFQMIQYTVIIYEEQLWIFVIVKSKSWKTKQTWLLYMVISVNSAASFALLYIAAASLDSSSSIFVPSDS